MPDIEREIFYKDPAAVLQYNIDWEEWLAGDTIASSSWEVTAGLTQDSDSNTTTAASVVLSGGTTGVAYTVTNQIVTAAGWTDERSMTIKVQNR